jgi:hypothetical protein
MFRVLLFICTVLVVIPFLSCEDANNVSNSENESQTSSQNSNGKEIAIMEVLYERWQKGYQDEDIEKYKTALWLDFQHVLDDETILNIKEEEEAAERVFSEFKDIIIEISDIKINFLSETKAKVETDYKIQLLLQDIASDDCVYEGYYAEGKNTFTFRFDTTDDGVSEWRIARWEDKAFGSDEIKRRYSAQ